MNNGKQYDFFSIGLRHAKDGIDELRKMANIYERDFGRDAREEFELGIASIVPQYANFYQKTSEEPIKTDRAITDYGKENTRNNSYFGSYGTGVQYYTNANGTQVYNDPNPEGKTNSK